MIDQIDKDRDRKNEKGNETRKMVEAVDGEKILRRKGEKREGAGRAELS